MALPVRRHPALMREEGFLPPGIDGGSPMEMPQAQSEAPGIDGISDEGNGAPGADPMKPSQEGEGEMAEEDADVSPDMVAAGVRCLNENQGTMTPEDLVKDIYAAMHAAHEGGETQGEEAAEGEEPDLSWLMSGEGA